VTVNFSRIAARTGLSASGVSRILRGRRHPRPDNLLRLAKCLRIRPGKLLEMLRRGSLAGGRRPRSVALSRPKRPARDALLEQIRRERLAIQARSGVLSEGYLLIREDRDR